MNGDNMANIFKTFKITCVTMIVFYFVLFSHSFGSPSSTQDKDLKDNKYGKGLVSGDGNVVAKVNGVLITKDDIYDDGTRSNKALQHLLVSRIQDIIIKSTCREHGITVSNAEIDKFWDENSRGMTKQSGDDAVIEYYILQTKMNKIIDESLSRENPEFQRCIKKEGHKNRKVGVRGKKDDDPFSDLRYVLNERAKWWSKRFRNADVVIFRPELKGAIHLLEQVR